VPYRSPWSAQILCFTACGDRCPSSGNAPTCALRAAPCALRPTSAQIPPPRRCSPSPFAGVGVVSGVWGDFFGSRDLFLSV